MNGADALVSASRAAGIDVCFANPGTTEMAMVDALTRSKAIRPVLALFEGVASGAADGYARIAGRPASVMLHLPALVMIKHIEKVFRALQKINLAVRGLYGEGSRASGDFYQISNQVTLGKSETQILNEIRDVIPRIIEYERQARSTLVKEGRQALQDRISRAFGTLCNATVMTSDETMDLLSSVRLGINLGLMDDVSMPTVNELFIHTQPAHLQKLMGSVLDGEEGNAARARYLRTRLREPHPN